MRRPSISVFSAALLASTLLAGGAVAAAPPPDDRDDGSAAALALFRNLADDWGYTLIDPACSGTSASSADLTYTCYAMTTQGGPFIARTTLSSSDVVEFTILAQPGQPFDADANSPVPADAAEPARFDALAYFDTLFSREPARIAALQHLTAPGSPAEAYAIYQLAFAENVVEMEAELPPSYVYLTSDGVLICVNADLCVMATDLAVINGQLADFSIDGNEIAPRLGRPGQPIAIGTSTAQTRAAYRPVAGGREDSLRVYLELTSSDPAVFELSAAVYIGADGSLTPLDRETSVGAADVTVKGSASAALDFPGAMPGGQVRFVVYPDGDAAPLAAVVPIESFVAADEHED